MVCPRKQARYLKLFWWLTKTRQDIVYLSTREIPQQALITHKSELLFKKTGNLTLHLSKTKTKLLSPIIRVRFQVVFFQGPSSISAVPSAGTQTSFKQCSVKSNDQSFWAVTHASVLGQNCFRHPALQRTPTSSNIYFTWRAAATTSWHRPYPSHGNHSALNLK